MKKNLIIITLLSFLSACSTMDVINVGAGIYGGIEKDNK